MGDSGRVILAVHLTYRSEIPGEMARTGLEIRMFTLISNALIKIQSEVIRRIEDV